MCQWFKVIIKININYTTRYLLSSNMNLINNKIKWSKELSFQEESMKWLVCGSLEVYFYIHSLLTSK
jgi:hypothetical protein